MLKDVYLIRVSTFELRLPAMSVRIDESRTDGFIGAVDDFDSFGCGDVLRDSHNLAMLDEDAGLGWDDMVVRVMDKGDTIFQ
jgi:hypothetical protein